MKKIKEKCIICNSEIDEYDYYITKNNQYICSEECAETALDKSDFIEEIWEIRYCPAHDYCKQMNNLRVGCVFKNNINIKKSPIDYIQPGKTSPNWCSPAESSQIISNVRLFNFVKKSEKSSAKLNEESLKQNKLTNKLTWVMLGVSFVNLVLICVQIYLQLITI